MTEILESQIIAGVKFTQLRFWTDERGRFMETFRTEWFPEMRWNIIQTNCSYSRANVLRGLHYHHRQVDYWYVPQGAIRVGLVDLRPALLVQSARTRNLLHNQIPQSGHRKGYIHPLDFL